MRRNWMQLLTLCLCALLTGLTLYQGQRIDRLESNLSGRISNMEQSVSNEVRSIASDIARELEENARLVAGYTLEPVEISSQDRTLTGEVCLTLKEWYADTEVTLVAELGGETRSLSMEAETDGTFRAVLEFPVEGNCEIFLKALICGGGLTKTEDLGSWGDYTMLLPLRNEGGGWTGPEYLDGRMASSFEINIGSQYETASTVVEPEFLVYRNGELVQTLPAVRIGTIGDTSVYYRPDIEGRQWSVECDVTDIIDIRFRCQDEYGLGYDFLFATWCIEESQVNGGSFNSAGTFGSNASGMTIFWPE